MHYAETTYGFEYGSATVERCVSDEKRGWVLLRLKTPKYSGAQALSIYVTKTGKVRIYDATPQGEWTPPTPLKKKGV